MCLHSYIHACMHAGIHTYIHTYIRAYVHTCIPTYIHTYIHTYTHTHIHTCIRAYVHTCIPTYIHTYIHTYMLRTVIANFDVECILRAKTLQLHLTGMGRWKDPTEKQEATIAIVNARWNQLEADPSLSTKPNRSHLDRLRKPYRKWNGRDSKLTSRRF